MKYKSLSTGKRALILMLALIIGSFTFLGFLSMAEMPDHGGHCPISILMASDCSSYTESLGMMVHHVSLAKSFTQGITVGAVVLLLALLYLLIIRKLPDTAANGPRIRHKIWLIEEILFFHFQKFLNWLMIIFSREYALSPRVHN